MLPAVLAGAAAAAATFHGAQLSGSPVCPANSTPTACAADATCCPVLFSATGYGCCNGLGPGAVCCGLQACCPAGTTCVNTPPYSSVCMDAKNNTLASTQVCTPGAQYPASAAGGRIPAIAIGDSVSIGYTPPLAALLNDTIFLQHSPWAGGGGTDAVANGVNCELNFIYDAAYTPQPWKLVSWNFGLHDLQDNSTAGLAAYSARLTNFTDTLIATTAPAGAKLLYVTTTPYMPAHVAGDMIVEELNAIAVGIMASRGIPVADLYGAVTAYCGESYRWCSICDDEFNNATGVYCGYHYTADGWAYLASFLEPIYRAVAGG
jgi:hypothetical protein